MKVPGGRALVAVDIARGYELWSEAELLKRTAAEHYRAVKRAHILDVGHLVYARSDDLVARSPTMPPWAIYPLSPALCARLITDSAMYFVTMSSEALLAALRDVGLAAEWVLPSDQARIQPQDVVLRAHGGGRTVELRWAEMQRRLLFELAELPGLGTERETTPCPQQHRTASVDVVRRGMQGVGVVAVSERSPS